MNPIALVLLLVGYVLLVPIATQMKKVVHTQNRLAMSGHQLGIGVVILGWIVGGRVPLIWIHLLWAVAAIVWFNWYGGRPARTAKHSEA